MKLLSACAPVLLAALLAALPCRAQEAPAAYDAAKAQAWGANDNGLRAYTLVLLKTGPKRMPDGPARDEMFKGHFANMQRLAKEGLLVYAGPLDGVEGLRGLFIFASTDPEVVRKAVDADPVVANGEMVAEPHRHFGSAALMAVNEWHPRLVRPKP
ncbi:YciI family protein [Roseateles sp.]|uniref:YciI family protein n=1 Tax=Roseateles sp. TaxID=1971397 RepID=UPI002DFB43A5|nr:YciI family protein [Roseateles sp.]